MLFCNIAFSQQPNPVRWKSSTEKISETEYYLVFTAEIQSGWHLYNLQIPEGGPIATTFTFDKINGVKLVGKVVTTSKPTKAYSDSFGMDLEYFSDKAVFKQKVTVAKAKVASVAGNVRFMCCDDHQCIPPTEYEFVMQIK